MEKTHSFISLNKVAPLAIGVAFFACFFAPAMLAQQSKLSSQHTKAAQASPYLKAAQTGLQAIESDDSLSQDPDSETTQKLDATEQQARSAEEVAFAKLLRQVQRRRLQDNDLLHAYGRLIEVENAIDDSEGVFVRQRRDSALSQLADSEEDIMRREVGCFKQLEQSISKRSIDAAPACSEWIQRKKSSQQDSLIGQ